AARPRGLYHICSGFVNQSITARPAHPARRHPSRASVAVQKNPSFFSTHPKQDFCNKTTPQQKNVLLLFFPKCPTRAPRQHTELRIPTTTPAPPAPPPPPRPP